ncbi:hypothetical protein C0993_007826 [Termitomyces sp. T159_Od127]|nr:hypothetical protein C0993_007826 [Termitomyces sp. T159_Od127]
MHRRAVLACKSPHETQPLLGLGSRRYNHVSSSTKQERLAVTRGQYKSFQKQTYKIIERARFTPPDWKDTPTLRGTEMKLTTLIKDHNTLDRKSVEQEAFEMEAEPDEDEEPEETGVANSILPPGTFVETRRSLILVHGVVIGEHVVGRRKKMTTLMSSGEIWYPGQYDVLFAFPDFVPADVIERCGSDQTVESQGQINARIEVLRRLRDMERKTEIMQNVVSMKSNKVYHKVKSPDPEAWSTTTLHEAAAFVALKPNDMTLFALHKYIMSNSLYFVADQSYETSRIIHVRPQAHVRNIQKITEWMRMPDGPIQSFAAKVKKVIPKFQEIQETSREEKPSYGPASHAWSAPDRIILTFLHNSLRQTRSNQSDPYSLGVSHIIRQISPEKLDVNIDIYETLVNIGALAPWQDLACLDPAIGLDIEPEATSSWVQRREATADRGFASINSSGTNTPLGPEDFHRTDPLESVRHDFGDLPVFVIDDADAQELDDGLSIERIPSEPDNLWLHVHIADPASLIPSTNVLAKEAYTRTTTLYLTHRTWPIFPHGLMSHPTLGLSLGRKTQDSPLRVITFSGKIDNKGQLLDYKVRAGLIKNVNVITYEQANSVLGHSEDNDKWYPFGRKLDSSPKSADLSDSHAKDIRDLFKIANHLMAKRYRDGVIIPTKNVVSLQPIVRPPPEIAGPLHNPMIFRGFPTFEYSVMQASDQDSGARLLVAEAMKLACRVASRFCTDHNVPVVRRVADPVSLYAGCDPQQVLDMRTPNCYIPFHRAITKIEVPSISSYSMEPKGHYTLGVAHGEGYTRATSPLRRYIDLVVHWQIHHALLGSKASKASPPFNAGEIWEIIKTASSREKMAMIIERIHHRFWQLMFIQRWAKDHGNLDSPDGPLGSIKAYTLTTICANARSGVWQVQVDCPDLGLIGILDQLPHHNFPVGSAVDVKIREIVLGTKPQVFFMLKNS